MKVLKRILKDRIIYYHIIGWILFIGLQYFFFPYKKVQIRLEVILLISLSNFLLFYINYIYLIPFLLFRKKTLTYVISTLLISLLFFYSQSYIAEKQIQRAFGQQFPPNDFYREIPEKGSFKPLLPKPPGGGTNPMTLYNVLLFIAASSAIRLIQKFDDEEKKKKDSENRKTRAELDLLKQQVNPHFLFNSLNSIYSLANRKSDLTSEAVLKLSNTLRYMLYDVNQLFVMLKNEIDHLKEYIELQKFRLTDDTKISLEIIGDPSNYQIEPIILIPFVENAFKFGADNVHESFIRIYITITNGELQFNIKNKIVNRQASNKEERSGGIGLNNVKRRLEILYSENHSLEIVIKDDVFDVFLKLKLKK
jgi:two-component system, LytTR family, sensor kinase